jgi:hypothetical protein
MRVGPVVLLGLAATTCARTDYVTITLAGVPEATAYLGVRYTLDGAKLPGSTFSPVTEGDHFVLEIPHGKGSLTVELSARDANGCRVGSTMVTTAVATKTVVATLDPDAPPVCDCDQADHDGFTDLGCPAVPDLIGPADGTATGSNGSAEALHPRFSWQQTPGADSYLLELSTGCATPGFATCDFPSPTDFSTRMTYYKPAAALPAAAGPPAGTRTYWRVRACAGPICGAWSKVRYLDVGRMASDFDGDGLADVLVGAPAAASGAGAAYVCYGSGSWQCHPIAAPVAGAIVFGAAVAAVGDVNGDGYADAAVGAPASTANADAAWVWLGGPTGLSATPIALTNPDTSGGQLGASIVAGDVDGDGYSDVIVAEATGPTRGAHVFHGGPDGPSRTAAESVTVPGIVSVTIAAGDLDGDGLADVALADRTQTVTGLPNAGIVWIFHGATGTPDLLQSPAPEAGGGFGASLAIADVDGDGRGDLIVGSQEGGFGAIYAFAGGTPVAGPPIDMIVGPPTNSYDFGVSMDVGDVDGDGRADILAGAGQSAYAYLYRSSESYAAPNPPTNGATNSDFGAAVGLADVSGSGHLQILAGAGFASTVYVIDPDTLASQQLVDPVTDPSDEFGIVLAP